MRNQNPIKARDAIVVYGLLGVLMIIGSIWDYPISLALHDQTSWFGNFFAAYGEIPAMLLGNTMAGTMLIVARNKEKKGTGIFQMIAGSLMLLMGIAATAFLPTMYLTTSPVVLILIGLVINVFVILLTVRMCRDADRATVIKVAAVCFIVVLGGALLVNIVKIPWGRARMRLVAVDERAYFMPWWQVGGELKDPLTAAGVAADEFKSFPSGHTVNGAAAMLLAFLALVSKKLENKGTILFYIGVIWGLLVAVSRIVMGAHYLTDTVIGFAISLMLILTFSKVFFGKRKIEKIQS